MAGKPMVLRSFLSPLLFVCLCFTMATSQTLKVLHNFGGTGDGAGPQAALAIDGQGNLFGTTDAGGAANCGTVFEMSPGGNGTWTESVVLSFQNGLCNSYAAVTFDTLGNLYGTTLSSPGGNGAVFELSPAGGGQWVATLLHNFNSQGDGQLPEGGVTLDNSGHLYGTTQNGGAYGYGLVYGITLQPSVTYSILKSFQFPGPNLSYGWYPDGSIALDSSGRLYGVTESGGFNLQGTVFRLAASAQRWVETPLYSFKGYLGQDGSGPFYGLVADSQGNLYGTAPAGGNGSCSFGCGVVFRLSPNGNGWTEKVLYNFQGGTDGEQPFCNLTFDRFGNIYGTTTAGGSQVGLFGYGTVFKLTPGAGDQWTETVLHHFTGGLDGATPNGGVVMDSSGNLYGTAQLGGSFGLGTVWEVTP